MNLKQKLTELYKDLVVDCPDVEIPRAKLDDILEVISGEGDYSFAIGKSIVEVKLSKVAKKSNAKKRTVSPLV